MPEYDFTLILDAGDHRTLDQVEDDLYGGNCDDALLSFGDGVVELDFTREAKSAAEAISSAIRDVTAAGYTVTRLGPDLVSTPEVARLLKVTRANVLQLMKGKDAGGRGKGDFAKAIDQLSGRPIFRLRDVAQWAAKHNKLSLEQFRMAHGIACGNNLLERFRLSKRKLSGKKLIEELEKASQVELEDPDCRSR